MKKTIQDLIDETKAEIQYLKEDLCDWGTGDEIDQQYIRECEIQIHMHEKFVKELEGTK